MFDLFLRRDNIANRKKQLSISKIRKILKNINIYENVITMIESIIEMDYLTVRDVMVPRVDVQTLNIDTKRNMLMQNMEQTTYSRFPVYDGNIDNLIGIIHIRDIYKILLKNNKGLKQNVRKMLTEPYFVPEAKKLSDLIKEFQLQKQHMALVVDEYGGFAGIITFEDILEVFLGDIQDEFDTEHEEIRKIGDGVYSLDARTSLDNVNEKFNLNLEDQKADTIGGYLIMKLGYIPKMKQNIKVGDLTFKVIAKRKNSLLRIRLKTVSNQDSSSDNNE
ncbi:MAG TPA: hemolysin family protein [Spirochaetota bacterium]|nr:hemolysin family protein [Spirochaetota bacterium]